MQVAINSLTGKTKAKIFRSKARCLKTTKQLITLAKSMNANISDLIDGTKILTFSDGTKRTIQCQNLILESVRESVQELGEYLTKYPDQISQIGSGVMELLTSAEYFAKAAMNSYTTDQGHCRRVAENHLESLHDSFPQVFSKKNAVKALN